MSKRYVVMLSKQARKDLDEFSSEQHTKITKMFERMETEPLYEPCEELVLNLYGKYSRRINVHDRMVFEIRDDVSEPGEVYVIRLKGHCKDIHSFLAL